jgi:hypothetical protein
VRKARRCNNLRRMGVQREGRFEEPFPLAYSFLTIFLHEQKGGAPGGRNPPPVKRITAVRIYSLSLFRRLRAAPSPEGRWGLPHLRALSTGRDISLRSAAARPEQSEGPSEGALGAHL